MTRFVVLSDPHLYDDLRINLLHTEFDAVYGSYFRLLAALGLLNERDDTTALTDAGAYWLHALQDVFSIDYVSTLWGTSQADPWPQAVAL
jgi:oxygen-independent coproporphyrinogen-3 oxidase